MIDFSLTDAQRELQRTARTFAEREILPRIHELDATATYDRSLYEKMGAEGFLGLPIPEKWPDPLREADAGKPDIGPVPFGSEAWRVGVDGRIPLFDGTPRK